MRLFKRVDPYKLHKLSGCATYGEVKDYIEALKRKNPSELNRQLKIFRKPLGYSPLDHAFVNSTVKNYSIAALLLAHGADPYARSPGPDKPGFTLLHEAIQERNLGKIRLLLWYRPDYDNVLDPTGRITAQEALQRWANSGDAVIISYRGRRLTVVELAEETAQTAEELRRLKTRINEAQTSNCYAEMILCYRKLQAIYTEQAELERAIPYPSSRVAHDPWIDQKKNYMMAYYAVIANFYAQLAAKLTEEMERQVHQPFSETTQDMVHNPLTHPEWSNSHVQLLATASSDSEAPSIPSSISFE